LWWGIRDADQRQEAKVEEGELFRGKKREIETRQLRVTAAIIAVMSRRVIVQDDEVGSFRTRQSWLYLGRLLTKSRCQ